VDSKRYCTKSFLITPHFILKGGQVGDKGTWFLPMKIEIIDTKRKQPDFAFFCKTIAGNINAGFVASKYRFKSIVFKKSLDDSLIHWL
jgi:hypothetical protein